MKWTVALACFGISTLAFAGPGGGKPCRGHGFDHLEIAEIPDETTCSTFHIVVSAVDRCGRIVRSFNGSATWNDRSGSLTPTAPAPFVNGVSDTGGARVHKIFTNDAVTVDFQGESAASPGFDVGRCRCKLATQWETKREYQLVSGKNAGANRVSATSDAVIVVGQASSATNSQLWMVQRSADRGETWSVTDNFQSFSGGDAAAYGVAADSHDNIYVAGAALVKSGNVAASHALVRKSSDDGRTFTTVLDVGGIAIATAVAVDGFDRIYVSIASVLGANSWFVVRSTDGGASWVAVDSFPGNSATKAFPESLVAAADGHVFAGGRLTDTTGVNTWTVRGSASGNLGSWNTLDSYQLAPGFSADTTGSAIDSKGNVYFTGYASNTPQKHHWITRRASISSPSAWTTIDDFRPTTSSLDEALSFGITASLDDEIFTTGRMVTASPPAQYYETRVTPSQFGSFGESDSLIGATNGATAGQAAATDRDGDIFTVGLFTDPKLGRLWFVRRLSCQ